MALAFFLGMCTCLAVPRYGHGTRSWLCRDRHSRNHRAGQQPDLSVLPQPGALAWIDASYQSIDLSFLGLISYIGVIAAMVQILELVARSVQSFPFVPGVGYLLRCDHGQLCDPGWFTVHGRTGLQLGRKHGVLASAPDWLGTGDRGVGRLRRKLKYSNVPRDSAWPGITFIIAGLMALAFMSFAGIQL